MLMRIETDKRAQAAIDTALCINCGKCRTLCPTEAISEYQRMICRMCPYCDGRFKEEKAAKNRIRYFPQSREYAREVACSLGCPLGTIPEGYINLIRENAIDAAYELIVEHNPLPIVCSQICHHPCEELCKRGTLLDKPIAIRALKHYVIANHKPQRARFTTKYEQRIAIVGGGPAGLTAAYDLAKKGYPVTIFEKDAQLGGALNWGVPEFRLDKEAMRREIESLIQAGIQVRYGMEIGRGMSLDALLEQGFAGIIVAVGSGKGKRLPLKGGEEGLDLLCDAAEIMAGINRGDSLALGRKAVIIGGGSVALDTARSLRRKGVEACCACLEDTQNMEAPADEVQDAISEGVRVVNSAAPVEILREGHVIRGAVFRKVTSLKKEKGKFVIETQAASEFSIEGDMLVFAVGQETEAKPLDLLLTSDGKLSVNEKMETNHSRVYAAGDGCGASVNVVEAMASGRRAALSLDNAIWHRSLQDRVQHELKVRADYEELLYPVRLDHTLPVEVKRIREQTPAARKQEFIVDAEAVWRQITDGDEPQLLTLDKKKKVAVVGCGVEGMGAAWRIARAGYPVVLYEKSFFAGGSLMKLFSERYIDKKAMARGIKAFEEAGIPIITNANIGKTPDFPTLTRLYDAVLLAPDRLRSRKPDLEGNDGEGVYDIAIIMEKIANGEYARFLGKQVVIFGSDSLAVDAARLLSRQAYDVTLVAQEDIRHFKASAAERKKAHEEGVRIIAGAVLKSIESRFIYTQAVRLLRVARVENGEARVLQDSEWSLPCDSIIFSGEREPDTGMMAFQGLSVCENGSISRNDYLETNIQGVFAGCGEAEEDARVILQRLNGNRETAKIEPEKAESFEVNYEDLPGMEQVPDSSFILREAVYTDEEAKAEASRCMKCGYEEADGERCLGCGICAAYCPANAITMVEPGFRKRETIVMGSSLDCAERLLTAAGKEK